MSHPFGYTDTYKKLTASPNITAIRLVFFMNAYQVYKPRQYKTGYRRHRVISYNEADKPDAMQFEIGKRASYNSYKRCWAIQLLFDDG